VSFLGLFRISLRRPVVIAICTLGQEVRVRADPWMVFDHEDLLQVLLPGEEADAAHQAGVVPLSGTALSLIFLGGLGALLVFLAVARR
jgi:hypothetical protein